MSTSEKEKKTKVKRSLVSPLQLASLEQHCLTLFKERKKERKRGIERKAGERDKRETERQRERKREREREGERERERERERDRERGRERERKTAHKKRKVNGIVERVGCKRSKIDQRKGSVSWQRQKSKL